MPRQHYKVENFRAQDCIGYLVKHVHGLMLERIEAEFAEHGFTFTQWAVLRHLRDGTSKTAADLARETRHDSGALTRMIDQLESRGLIVRHRSIDDRRVVTLALTPAGHALLGETTVLTVDALNWALEGFNRDELARLTEMLQRLKRRLHEPREPATRPALRAGAGR
jgi:DNA-binding MarR family transcriptional regulator